MIYLFAYLFPLASFIIAGWVLLKMIVYIRAAFRISK